MVEFRIEHGTGEAYLMEVNGRIWGSLQLAIDAGVNLPIAFDDFDGLQRPVGGGIDIGAFEYLPNANPTVPVRKQ